MHPDGYMHIKDRSKDIIISGGENNLLDRGRGRALQASAVAAAAVVAKDDEKWGETPCAFRGAETRTDRDHRRTGRMVPGEPRELQMPALRGVYGAAEDLNRQDPEIQAAGDDEGVVGDPPPQRPPVVPDPRIT